jgi:hypothetical protein
MLAAAMPVLETRELSFSEVHCVREVRLGVAAHTTSDSIRFYVELLGLRPWSRPRVVPGAFGVGNPRRGLLLQARHDPEVDEVRRRVTIVTPCLERLARRLREYDWPYERVQSFGYSDQRIYVHDPSGHRVEVRQSRLI